MDRRLELQKKFEEILGSRNVYFQPPETIRLKYPCIIYSHSRYATRHADDKRYLSTKAYDITIIDSNPDSKLPEKLMELPYCNFSRKFVVDNLYHYALTIYY